MTDAQRYFRGAREMIRRARKTDNLFEARRCRFLAEWFLEYRQKLLSIENRHECDQGKGERDVCS